VYDWQKEKKGAARPARRGQNVVFGQPNKPKKTPANKAQNNRGADIRCRDKRKNTGIHKKGGQRNRCTKRRKQPHP